MLYLFNSGYRRLYATNVLNTLFLPEGYVNDYRYRSEGQNVYIEPKTRAKLKSLIDHLAVIIYVDRFASGGYGYIPLRLGTVLATYEDSGMVFISLKLGKFLSVKDFSIFKDNLIKVASELPKLTDSNPKATNDGFYAIHSENIVFGENFIFGETAWGRTVDALHVTKDFEATETSNTIFIRSDIYKGSTLEGEVVSPILQNKVSRIPLNRGSLYELRLSYRYPNQLRDPAALCQVEVKSGENCIIATETTIPIDTHTNTIRIPFASKKYCEDNDCTITFSYTANDVKVTNLSVPSVGLSLRINEPASYWLQVIVALIIFAFSGVFLGIDYAKIDPLTFDAIWDNVTFPKILAGFAQAGSLFWFFRLGGKKVL